MATNNFDPTKYGAIRFDPTQYGATLVSPAAAAPPTESGFWSKVGSYFANIPGKFMGGVNKDLTARGQQFASSVLHGASVDPGKDPMGAIRATAELGLGTGASALGGIFDVAAEGVKAVTPEFIKNYVKENVSLTPTGRTALESFKTGWKILSDKYGEQTMKDVSDVLNIAGWLIGTKVGGEAAEEAVSAGTETVGGFAGKAKRVIESELEGQKSQAVLDYIRPEVSSLTKAERIAAAEAGKIKEGIGITGFFKKPVLYSSEKINRIAQSLEGIINPKAKMSANIAAIDSKIGELAGQTSALPEQYNSIFNDSQIRKVLDAAKDDSRVIFGGDKALENNYNSIVDEFMKILKTKGNKLSGVLDARREFDQIIKRKFPNLFDKFGGDNIRANAVQDIRQAANDFVADKLPEGNPFKKLLEQQTDLFRGRKMIAEKFAPTLGSRFAKLTQLIRNHPWLSVEAAGGVGIGGAAMAGLLSNPAMWAGLALYGSFRVGKAVVTSQWLKRALIGFLGTTEKMLSPEESGVVKNMITNLDDANPPTPQTPNQAGIQSQALPKSGTQSFSNDTMKTAKNPPIR